MDTHDFKATADATPAQATAASPLPGERRRMPRSTSQRLRLMFMGIDQVAVNWSTGGVLLEDHYPTLAVGATLSGLLSVEGEAGRYRFSAEIVRREIETKKLALSFVNPSPALRGVLNRDEIIPLSI